MCGKARVRTPSALDISDIIVSVFVNMYIITKYY